MRGLYTAVTGLLANVERLSRLANNAANATTIGYKQDVPVERDFRTMLISKLAAGRSPYDAPVIGRMGTGLVAGQPTRVDLSPGPLIQTGNELDLALSGDGLFVVRRGEQTYYTRAGSFQRDANGRLVTDDGGLVQGQDGPISLPSGAVRVDASGGLWVDGQLRGQLRLVDFEATAQVRKVGGSYLELADEAALQPATGTTVHQGFLEGANTQTVDIMVEMMGLVRAAEASQHMVRMLSEIQDQGVGLGKLR